MDKKGFIRCEKCGRMLNPYTQAYIDKHLARCAKNHRPVCLHGSVGRPSKKEARELERKRRMIMELLEDRED